MTDTSDTPLTDADETISDPNLNDVPIADRPSDNERANESDRYADEDEDQTADGRSDERFEEGQRLRFLRVRFPGNNRSFAFLAGKSEYTYGQKVVAMSDRGLSVGFVNSFPYEVTFHKGLLPVRSIVRAASAEDLAAEQETFRQEKRLEMIIYKHIERHKLDMQMTNVELTQGGKKAIFHFTAPTRIDFRGLVHDLVGELKMRVELRQVSVRDRSASVGGLGPCGRELCCSSFLAKYGNVGIKLAKNQDLSLNSSKINGVCGQLKCCLTYEDEVYQEKRKKLPRDNGLIKTKDGFRGKVIRLHILEEQFEMISPEGVIRRYVAEMWDGPAEGLEMPRYFENGITDNSKTIIGMEDVLERQAQERKTELTQLTSKSKDWADSIYEQLFGEKSLGLAMPELLEPEGLGARKVMPDEEEEITYVPTDEDALVDDEDDLDEGEDFEDGDDEAEDDAGPVRSEQRPLQKSEPQRHEQPQRPRQDHTQRPRHEQPQRPRHEQDQRPRHEQGPRPPRPEGARDAGVDPNRNRGEDRSGGNRNRHRNRNRNRGRGGNGGGGNPPSGGGRPQ